MIINSVLRPSVVDQLIVYHHQHYIKQNHLILKITSAQAYTDKKEEHMFNESETENENRADELSSSHP
jgi:hypothetical protein